MPPVAAGGEVSGGIGGDGPGTTTALRPGEDALLRVAVDAAALMAECWDEPALASLATRFLIGVRMRRPAPAPTRQRPPTSLLT